MPRCRSLSSPYDHGLSRTLLTYIATGLAFMVVPGTLIGVINLLAISAKQTPGSGDIAWIQAHGHAQIFGWLGTFILGVGYYAIPRLRLAHHSSAAAWSTYVLWTAGVTARWAAGMWDWHWRALLASGAILEVAAVAIFCVAVYLAPRREVEDRWRTSVLMITASGAGFAAAVAMHGYEAVVVALRGSSPLFPAGFNQRFLAVATWGFIVPYVWGFSTRWLPPLLGLAKSRKSLLLPVVGCLFLAVAAAVAGAFTLAGAGFLAASIGYIAALRLFEKPEKEPKLRGVHGSAGVFVRIAYAWLLVAAILTIAAARVPLQSGIAGAGRHALTVGFFVVIVFTVAPRVLPAFLGVRRLWSAQLMFASLLLVNAGCAIRVASQMLAYSGAAGAAWHWLPVSAIIEMFAVGIFAFNMLMSLTTGTPLDTILEMQEAK